MNKKIIVLILTVVSCLSGLSAMTDMSEGDKMYIDADEFSANTKGDAFHIHIGHNVWLVTNSVHRDSRGMFSYECNVRKNMKGVHLEYEKTWKCPYCYNYWPLGIPCKNKDCPSRYGKDDKDS